MPKRRKEEREEAYVIILFLFILGIGLLLSGYLVGIIAILLSLVITIAMFPAVGETISEIVKGLMSLIEGRKTKRISRPSSEEAVLTEEPEPVTEIIQRIEDFKPYKRPRKEKQLEDMLMQYLRVYYPSLRTQLSYERTKIDAQIGKIGIEIKYQPNEAELDRLYGQIEKYLRHLDYVIAVIGYERSRESVDFFRKRLRRRGLDDQVSVITIP